MYENDHLRAEGLLALAKHKGVAVRVSGQRHFQSVLVADDNRNNPPQTPDAYLVDMSCYVDVGNKASHWDPARTGSP